MVCKHLKALDDELTAKGIKETFRGEVWGKKCREWVYYNCWLDRESLRKRFSFDPCVSDHDHLGTHDGSESGFVCDIHQDGIMGVHEQHKKGRLIIT